MPRKTGPVGGAAASRNARRIAVPSSPSVRTSCDHLRSEPASPTRSPERSGSVMRCLRSCWPAVTTIGVPAATAFVRLPSPFASPAIVCRFTKLGRRVSRPYASAIPTAVASCSASTYCGSSRPASASTSGSSVVPGFPNTCRTSSSASASSRISDPDRRTARTTTSLRLQPNAGLGCRTAAHRTAEAGLF